MERDYDAEFAAIIAGYHTVSEKDLPLEPQDPDRMPVAGQQELPLDGLGPDAPDVTDTTDTPTIPDTAEPATSERATSWTPGPEQTPFAPVVNPSPIVWRGSDAPADREPSADRGDSDGYGDGDVPPPGSVEAGLDEGHFEPPPVQLPPQEDLQFWGIVIGLVAGPLLLLWVVFFASGESSWWGWIGTGLTLGGFALLILRQPTDRDDEDDGARV